MNALDVLVGAVIFCVVFLVALFVLSLFRGARMVRQAELALLSADPADEMSPAFRAKLQEWARTAAAIDQARADFEPAPPVSSDPGEALWQRLIDPDSPDYMVEAEWWHNIAPELRRKANES